MQTWLWINVAFWDPTIQNKWILPQLIYDSLSIIKIEMSTKESFYLAQKWRGKFNWVISIFLTWESNV